jgi:hypothetical protein
MTLIQTAKLNGMDPMAWLTDVLERIVSGRTKAHELHTLLPWNWTPPDPGNHVVGGLDTAASPRTNIESDQGVAVMALTSRGRQAFIQRPAGRHRAAASS